MSQLREWFHMSETLAFLVRELGVTDSFGRFTPLTETELTSVVDLVDRSNRACAQYRQSIAEATRQAETVSRAARDIFDAAWQRHRTTYGKQRSK